MPHPGLHIFLQDEIARDLSATSAATKIGAALTRFDARTPLDRLESVAPESRVAVFCSLTNATRILRHYPRLAHGLVLPRAFLEHATYTALIPDDMRLNTSGIYLPWGRIPQMIPALDRLFANGVFLRPGSPMKPFTGFSAGPGDLARMHRDLCATLSIDPCEIVYIDHAKSIPPLEWRCWIVDAQPVSFSAYSWDDRPLTRNPVPDPVRLSAERTGSLLAMREQVYTADFTEDGKLIELNALSTSGWYPGLDVTALFDAIDGIFI